MFYLLVPPFALFGIFLYLTCLFLSALAMGAVYLLLLFRKHL